MISTATLRLTQKTPAPIHTPDRCDPSRTVWIRAADTAPMFPPSSGCCFTSCLWHSHPRSPPPAILALSLALRGFSIDLKSPGGLRLPWAGRARF